MYIFIMYLQTLDSLNFSRAQHDLKTCAVYVHMICFKLGRLIKHGLQSWLGLYYGKEPTLKYWLAMTKLKSLESVCTLFMTLKITTRSSERAQIKQNIPLPNFSSPNLPGHILTGSAQCLSGKVWGI